MRFQLSKTSLGYSILPLSFTFVSADPSRVVPLLHFLVVCGLLQPRRCVLLLLFPCLFFLQCIEKAELLRDMTFSG